MYNEQNGNNGLKLFLRTKNTYAIQNLKLHKAKKGIIVRCLFFSFLLYNILADKDQNLRIYTQKEHKTSDCLLIFYVPLISTGLYSVQRFFLNCYGYHWIICGTPYYYSFFIARVLNVFRSFGNYYQCNQTIPRCQDERENWYLT